MKNDNAGACAEDGNEESAGAATGETTATKSPESAPMYKNVLCQKCGKRILIEVGEGQSTHRCPVCKALFQVSCRDGVVTVAFAPD